MDVNDLHASMLDRASAQRVDSSSGESRCNEPLVAIRSAGKGFQSDWNVRSPLADTALARIDTIAADLSALSAELIDRLYELVPRIQSKCKRQAAIESKRDIFNLRKIDLSAIVDSVDQETRSALACYDALISEREDIVCNAGQAVIGDIRARLKAVCERQEVKCLLEYSVPMLLPQLRKNRPERFSDAEITAYSYLARSFSKANPRHVLASICAPQGQFDSPLCQVILDTECFRELEQRLLLDETASSRTFLYLASRFTDGNGTAHFLARPAGASRHRVSVRGSSFMSQLMEFFLCTLPDDCTEQNLTEHLVSERVCLSTDDAKRDINKLCDVGVLVRYLVRSDDEFAMDLMGHDPSVDPLVERLDQLHLSTVAPEELPSVDLTLRSIARNEQKSPSLHYFVDLYTPSEDRDYYCGVVDRIVPDLAGLQPLLTQRPSRAPRRDEFATFVRDRVAHSRRKSVQLVEIVYELLRLASDGVSLATRPAAELDREERCVQDGRESICVNGIYDQKSDTFFVSNIFPGNGRYQCRYRLLPMINPANVTPDGRKLVQVVAPFGRNRSYVPAVLNAGISFDGRYCHKFDTWIEPSQVSVTVDDDTVVFLDHDGHQLEFVHYGLALTKFLPIPYQVLLINAVDAYHQPVLNRNDLLRPQDVPSCGFSIRPAIKIKRICIRRERWISSVVWLRSMLIGCTGWELCIALRKLLRETGRNANHWYYRLPERAPKVGRPAYLDVRNPLSAALFRKRLWGCAEAGAAIFAEMKPSAKDLRDGHLVELMVEV
jgi:hypothetical protein